MLKLIGCMLLTISCTGLGFSKAYEYKCHIQELDELKKCFCMILHEINYCRLPFTEVLMKVSKKASHPFGKWMEQVSKQIEEDTNSSFAKIWETETDKLLHQLLLTREEGMTLYSLGTELGSYNIQMEEQILSWMIQYLEDRKNDLMQELGEKQRLCRSLGILSGIFISILLL